MSGIVVINGSPKRSGSTSERLIKELERIAGGSFETYHALALLRQDRFDWLEGCDTLVMVLPVYVDALPGHMVQLLTRLEPAIQALEHKPRLFALCVCGFYEGTQTRTALHILRNFAERAGLAWKYGVGVGSGGFIMGVKDMAVGPTRQIHVVLSDFVSDLKRAGDQPLLDIFVTPGIPRALYALGGNLGWRQQAKANGVKGQLRAKPFATG